MLKEGETVLYTLHGLCKVNGIEEMEAGGVRQPYYVLKPLNERESTIFVPVTSELIERKVRRVSSVAEIMDMIDSIPDSEPLWYEDEAQRRTAFKQILAGHDRASILRVIKALYLEQQKLKGLGKKLHVTDERIFNDAEKALYDEFAFVLKLSRDDVLPFITDKIEAAKSAATS